MRSGHDLASGRPLRVGVLGAGLIAQVMHLHYLKELSGLYEIAAVCDISEENARACADRYGIPVACADWHDLIARPLDAVLVLTSGSHAPIAIGAARAGRHVLVEKPMCFSVAEGQAMVAAAEESGVTLMVGYPKRYDPAYARFREVAGELTGNNAGVATAALCRALPAAASSSAACRRHGAAAGGITAPGYRGHRSGRRRAQPDLHRRAA